jgi:hypothetical protein
MNKLLALIVAGAFAFTTAAFAADPPKTAAPAAAAPAAAPTAANPQQEKMKTCNAQAGDKKGDERKAFMKTCLSAAPAKPESRMAMCNKKTAGMNKEDRAKAQSECMKAPA